MSYFCNVFVKNRKYLFYKSSFIGRKIKNSYFLLVFSFLGMLIVIGFMNFSPDGSENPVSSFGMRQIVANSRNTVDKYCKVLLQKKEIDLHYLSFWLFLPNEYTREINHYRWCG